MKPVMFSACDKAVIMVRTRMRKLGFIDWGLSSSINLLNPRWLTDSIIISASVRSGRVSMQHKTVAV